MDEFKPLAFTLFCFFMDERQMMAPMIKAKAHVNHYRAHDNELIPPFVQIL